VHSCTLSSEHHADRTNLDNSSAQFGYGITTSGAKTPQKHPSAVRIILIIFGPATRRDEGRGLPVSRVPGQRCTRDRRPRLMIAFEILFGLD